MLEGGTPRPDADRSHQASQGATACGLGRVVFVERVQQAALVNPPRRAPGGRRSGRSSRPTSPSGARARTAIPWRRARSSRTCAAGRRAAVPVRSRPRGSPVFHSRERQLCRLMWPPQRREQERGVESRREGFEGVGGALAQRDAPARPGGLPVLAQLAARERPWTVTTRAARSTSRRESANHSSGLNPVPAAKTTSGPLGPSSSATASTSSHDSNGRISAGRGSGSGRAWPGSRRSTSTAPPR
jgi:hypothetical protein